MSPSPLLGTHGMLLWQAWHGRRSHALKPDTSSICYDTLSISQKGPGEDEQCPTWEERGPVKQVAACFNLDPGTGGETRAEDFV